MDKTREMMVYKHNNLVQKSRHSLSLAQQKAMIYICSLIKPNSDELEYTFNISEYLKVCGIEKSGRVYEELKATLLELTNIGWFLPVDDNGDEVTVHWLTKARANKKSGKVSIRLDEDLTPFLLHLKEQTTRYELYNILALSSGYAVQLYEIFKSYAWTGKWRVSIDEFKHRIMIDGIPTYNHWGEVKRAIINVSLKQINEYTDLNVVYKDNGGRGKKATQVIFVINTKKKDDKEKAIESIEKTLECAQQEISATDEFDDFIKANTANVPASKKRLAPDPDPGPEPEAKKELTEYQEYTDLIRSNIEYDILKKQYPDRYKDVDEMVSIMVDTIVSKSVTVRIGGEDKPKEVVKSVFTKISFEHMQYIMECLEKNTTKVHNIKAYMLTTIYNAPLTIGNYYGATVRHAMYGDKAE